MFSLKNFEPRLYQQTIFASAFDKNTLVVLPTGLGKTAVAMLLTLKRLNDFPDSKVVFLAPTKPLVDQHFSSFIEHTTIPKSLMAVFTGSVSPKKRLEMWKQVRVVFSTPQGLENDVISGRISLKNVSLVIFDEAHRSVGNYSYTFIAKRYVSDADFPRILALTASPGSDVEKIKEVCKNLFIENVEVRTEDDPDVKPYVKEVVIDWIGVELSGKILELRNKLLGIYKSRIKKIKEMTDLNVSERMSKKDLLTLQAELRARISAEKDYSDMVASSLLAQVMKVQYALELLETQGVSALKKYFDRFVQSAGSSRVKAVKALMSDEEFTSAIALTTHLFNEGFEHPKLDKLCEIVQLDLKNKPDAKIIIFTQFRDSAVMIHKKLEKLGVKAKIFVGQQKKLGTGLSQKEQKKMIEEFKNNTFNVLISTSVGEEGLDIPQVDKVIFYEAVPSAIRQIQRRGRTGRQSKGYVSILYTKKTRDEAYLWVARRKESRMKRTLLSLKKELSFESAPKKGSNKKLSDFNEQKIRIIVDYREKNSVILHNLADKGVLIDLKKLNIADYVLSSEVAVEFKTVKDFVDSLVDLRLLSQVKALKETYSKPLIIVQGGEDIFSIRNVHKNAIYGMLITITLNYGIPILFTRNFKDTADLLYQIAKREQESSHKEFEFHHNKPSSLKEQQEYFISALPGIGLLTARELLRKFGSVSQIVNASIKDLKSVPLIGEKKAEKLKQLFDKPYT